MENKLYSSIIGFIIGDALGVPVEFKSRAELKENPVIDMREYGTYNQPKGSWSDDSTMTLCLMENLINGLDYNDICSKFLKWIDNGYMTPHGELFDIGISTSNAISNYKNGVPPLKCGGTSEYDNGNGSLMRVLPLAFYTMGMTLTKKFEIIENISSLTHRHIRSKIACAIYVQFVCELLKGYDKEKALKQTIIHIEDHYGSEPELNFYHKILDGNISTCCEDEIKSSGYVVDTLEAVMWCFFTTDNYKDCILRAVNLGEDTDTITAIVGGIAGLYYGDEGIPKEWINSIVKLDLIMDICGKFQDIYKPFDELQKYIPIMQSKTTESNYELYDKDASAYMQLCYDMGYMDFDYFDTLKRYSFTEKDDEIISAIDKANIELLIAINTYYFRKDRFCEGTLFECAMNGTFVKILKRMRSMTYFE